MDCICHVYVYLYVDCGHIKEFVMAKVNLMNCMVFVEHEVVVVGAPNMHRMSSLEHATHVHCRSHSRIVIL